MKQMFLSVSICEISGRLRLGWRGGCATRYDAIMHRADATPQATIELAKGAWISPEPARAQTGRYHDTNCTLFAILRVGDVQDAATGHLRCDHSALECL
jgi:hypothetical protein